MCLVGQHRVDPLISWAAHIQLPSEVTIMYNVLITQDAVSHYKKTVNSDAKRQLESVVMYSNKFLLF